jgi:hypothetical protein
MPKDEKDRQQPEKNPPLFSRREFALGSIALIGGYSLAESTPIPELSAEAQALKIEKSKETESLLDIRHITDDDLKRVLDHAEKTGKKLYLPESNRFLSKLRIVDTYFYAEYSSTESGVYHIHTAYSHRSVIVQEPD